MQQKNRRRVFRTSLSIENREAVNLYGAIRSWILHRWFLSSLWASCRRPTLTQRVARPTGPYAALPRKETPQAGLGEDQPCPALPFHCSVEGGRNLPRRRSASGHSLGRVLAAWGHGGGRPAAGSQQPAWLPP